MTTTNKKKEKTTKHLVLRNPEKSRLFRRKVELYLPMLIIQKKSLVNSHMELYKKFPLAKDLKIKSIL